VNYAWLYFCFIAEVFYFDVFHVLSILIIFLWNSCRILLIMMEWLMPTEMSHCIINPWSVGTVVGKDIVLWTALWDFISRIYINFRIFSLSFIDYLYSCLYVLFEGYKWCNCVQYAFSWCCPWCSLWTWTQCSSVTLAISTGNYNLQLYDSKKFHSRIYNAMFNDILLTVFAEQCWQTKVPHLWWNRTQQEDMS